MVGDKIEYYQGLASEPGELRKEIQDMVEFGEGDTMAYASVDAEFNLNAFAIGLGLENIEYGPEVHPGLVYRIDKPALTAILFWDGQIDVIDAPDQDAAIEGVQKTVERLRGVELYEGDDVLAEDIEITQL